LRIGSYTHNGYSLGQIGTYQLVRDTLNTIATQQLDETDDIALPDMEGHGSVYSLHQAMLRDTTSNLESIRQAGMVFPCTKDIIARIENQQNGA